MKNDIGRLMKQAQKMQADLAKAQEQLVELEITGESGGGMVRVVLNGKHQVRRVQIDREALGDDHEMLEDLVAAAFNDAVTKVEAAVRDKFAGLTSGLGLPPGMNLPF